MVLDGFRRAGRVALLRAGGSGSKATAREQWVMQGRPCGAPALTDGAGWLPISPVGELEMIRILTSGAAAAACLLMLAAPGAAQARRFSADDMPKIVRIGDPQISPDGRSVAIVVARANMTDDRWDSELELVDSASKQVQVLTHGRLGVGSPRWSPGGEPT